MLEWKTELGDHCIVIHCLCVLGEVTWPPWTSIIPSENKEDKGRTIRVCSTSNSAYLWRQNSQLSRGRGHPKRLQRYVWCAKAQSKITTALTSFQSWHVILKVQIKLVKGISVKQKRCIRFAVNHIETPNDGGSYNYLFLLLAKIKQTKILTDTLRVLCCGRAVRVSTEHGQIAPMDWMMNVAWTPRLLQDSPGTLTQETQQTANLGITVSLAS